MRISDWSSDVCSSDLRSRPARPRSLRLLCGEDIRLSELDPLSSGPDAKWFGIRVHKFLQDWQAAGLTAEAFDAEIAALRADPALDSLARAFWLPRIEPSLRWAAERVWAERGEGREPIAPEATGVHEMEGIRQIGRADRIEDRKSTRLKSSH